ncbi:ABC transporter substrate-binding protein [Paenibacillaceae bacterium]|nr:ABC transporter substrate-binding protein [Paenibacillaceae bacterium]
MITNIVLSRPTASGARFANKPGKRGKMMQGRKVTALMLLMLAVTIIAAACGDKGAELPKTDSTGGEEQQGETRTVEHAYGKTEIPVHPQRIAQYWMEDNLLSLEVPFIYSFNMPGYFLHDQIEKLGIKTDSAFPLNLEALAAANPDLIIISQYAVDDEAGYAQLNKIAPTIAFDPNDWQGSIQKLGDALGVSDKATAVIAAHQEYINTVKNAITDKIGTDKTIALIRPSAKDLQVFFPGFSSITKTVYTELGLAADDSIKKFEQDGSYEWGDDLSLEKIPELQADYILSMYGSSISTEDEFEREAAEVKEFEKSPLWKDLPAVKNGQVTLVSGRHWMMSGAIADRMKLEDVLKAVTN